MQRLILPVTLLTAVFAIGIGWYRLAEGFTLLEAVYQTVITLSTVGYAEVHPLDDSGRVFTIFFILAGSGLMLYTATALVELVVAGEVREMLGRRRTGRRVRRMESHVIVCGYGRVGQEIASQLAEHSVECLIVDRDPEAIEKATAQRAAVVLGDATEEPVLREAHIERARAIVGRRGLRCREHLHRPHGAFHEPGAVHRRSRGNQLGGAANDVGRRRSRDLPLPDRRLPMALSVVQPLMLDFVDVLAARQTPDEKILAEVVVGPASGLDGQRIAEAFEQNSGVSLLGVEHGVGEIVIGPAGSELLREGDRLMIYGSQQAIENLSARQNTG